MRALIIIMMVTVGFAGCNGFGGKSKEDELIVLREMNRSLENAFNFIEMKNNSTENSFVEKLIDPNTSLKAQSIKTQFDSTISFSRKIIAYVDSFEKDLLLSQGIVDKNSILSDQSISLTREISINSEKVHQLFEKLKNYRVKLLSLDSNVFNQFNERLPKFEMDNFNHKMSLIEDLNLISKLKTDIVTSEGFVIDY